MIHRPDVAHAHEAPGVTARQLLERTGGQGQLTAADLETWLLDSGLAEPNGSPDTLVPTKLAIGLAGSLEFLGD